MWLECIIESVLNINTRIGLGVCVCVCVCVCGGVCVCVCSCVKPYRTPSHNLGATCRCYTYLYLVAALVSVLDLTIFDSQPIAHRHVKAGHVAP